MKVRGLPGVNIRIATTRNDPYERAGWTKDKDRTIRRVRRWRDEHEWYDGRVEAFVLSRSFLEFDREDDYMWECTDILGRGAFGMVGKWTKFDKNGRAVDDIAIKQTVLDGRELDEEGRPTVPTEAVLVKALVDQGCRNVARLRDMRYFDCDRPKWRLYLEYYRYGTLHDLVQTYRRRNKRGNYDDRIPEAFIWQAFHDFAQACYHMKVLRLDSLGGSTPRGDHFALHLDLKGQNVLLGDAPGNEKLMPYPTLKVADWGCAEYTSLDDERNSKKWKGNGTICWMPPEQREFGRYGEDWERRILGNRDHPFSMKHVVWQIGANIYGLMTLDLDNDDLNARVNQAEGMEHMLRKHDYSPLMGYQSRTYSSELTSLVDDCVRVDPARRPSPYELVQRTQEGLARFTDRYRRTGEHPKLKL
ncbi:uncharacterized protein Z520_04125 [Fonsecaea multimorphosa CBS 102226]|uniref:non-specific serine/threonine protein kinase n=1 Tax=Fonsecaea multimorphosa CBS 102226 TaxID=1442371 RepID=A0A0D2KBF0_9EURO|nr:uncharacterized protein Z520_04125 [Fonsecaea multimorphosa CBS 102226]KIY00440.1 hypothetical protein Z520_04125 [Fonsecaea multimorphosa CBS 102226]OAL26954.1 hypothetical protein AYO22_03898 [Fonsecaea multimorphosa]